MKKLRLELEAVQVETFEVSDSARRAAGTVKAHITIKESCEDTVCCTPNATCSPTSFTLCACDSEDDFTCGASPTCYATSCGSCRDC